jgi:hypothetical protein
MLPGRKKAQEAHLCGYLAESQEVNTNPDIRVCTPPLKAVVTRNSLAPLSTTDIDTNTTGAENTSGRGSQKNIKATTDSDDFYHKPHSTPKGVKITH